MELEQPRNVILLTTPTGSKVSAIWKRTKDRWYIMESTTGDTRKPLEILTPRQFQDAIDNKEYTLEY